MSGSHRSRCRRRRWRGSGDRRMKERCRCRSWSRLGRRRRRRRRAGVRSRTWAWLRRRMWCRGRCRSGCRRRSGMGSRSGLFCRLGRWFGRWCWFARGFRCRRRSLNRLLFVLAAIFRIVFGFAWRHDLLLRFFLILNEFDIRHLRAGRRRYEKEEGENKGRDHGRDVKYVRTACRFGHLHHIFRVDMSSLNESGMVICVSDGKGDKSENQADDD